MTEHALRSAVAKAVGAAALLGLAWTFTVQPARAALEDRRMMLAAQEDAVEAFNMASSDLGRAEATFEQLDARARGMAESLARHASTGAVFGQIEAAAAHRKVRVHRTDPRGAVDVRASDSDRGAPKLTAEGFFIEFSGRYGDVAGFIDDLQRGLGIVRVREFRLSPDSDGFVRGTVTFTVYRTPPGTRILPEYSEPDDDQA